MFENSTGKTNEIEFETRVNGLLNDAANQVGKIGRTSLSADNDLLLWLMPVQRSTLNIAQMISLLRSTKVDGKRIPYGFEDELFHISPNMMIPGARGFVESSFIQINTESLLPCNGWKNWFN